MKKKMYVVAYTGNFGFIKPHDSMRDGYVKSQNFLAPSMVEGIRQKLNVSEISRYRLQCFDFQTIQMVIQAPFYEKRNVGRDQGRNIVNHGVMVHPKIFLAFKSEDDAIKASENHIFLARQEFILYPCKVNNQFVTEMTVSDFDEIEGWELIPSDEKSGMLVGFNRYKESKPMYGILKAFGNPLGHIPEPEEIVYG